MCPCYVNGRLAAQGVPVACEVDIYGALSEYVCQLAGDSVATLLDINNTVPQDMVQVGGVEDLFMAFHCGNTAASCMKGCAMCHQLIMHRLLEPDSEPNITRGTLEGQIDVNLLTMFRLQARRGGGIKAYLAQGNVLDIDPKSFGSIGVMEIPGFGRFYRYVLLQRGFPHHAAFTFEHVGAVIFDAMFVLGVYDLNTLPSGAFYPGENPFALPKVALVKTADSIDSDDSESEGHYRTAEVEELTEAAFAPFGIFHNMQNPTGVDLGAGQIHFHADVLRLPMESSHSQTLGISTCRVEDRPKIVNVTEMHKSTGEGMMPLDGNMLIHVAEPTDDGSIPWDRIRIFRVPQFTCVVINPGVFHHAPFLCDVDATSVSTLILLPEETYKEDCVPKDLPEGQQTRIIAK
jgi:ureidoglycolate hydrolase